MILCARCGETAIMQDGTHWEVDGIIFCTQCRERYHIQMNAQRREFTGIPKVAEGMKLILEGLRDELELDIEDVNFHATPLRVGRAYAEIFSGVKDRDKQIKAILATAFPSEEYAGMVRCEGIRAYSMCPHHFLPVEYDIRLAYLPGDDNKVLGLSKLARVAELCAKQPLMQESITQQIGEALEQINPAGVIVQMSGEHFCMKMRGVGQTHSAVQTEYVSGRFELHEMRQEFLALGKKV